VVTVAMVTVTAMAVVTVAAVTVTASPAKFPQPRGRQKPMTLPCQYSAWQRQRGKKLGQLGRGRRRRMQRRSARVLAAIFCRVKQQAMVWEMME